MGSKLSTQPYRGTRDFLPAEMSVRTQVFSTLYSVIESYGYTRYDGPTLEPIEMYEAKSGHEIVSDQLYRLTDRGGRVLAIRPEMTPSVARMIAANAETLQFPARWYSHVNCHRYERPQRGRVREHWQINVDVFGSESAEAEVEIFEMIHRMLTALGASPHDFILRVSDRLLVERALADYVDVLPSQMKEVFGVIDRWEKYPLSQSQETLATIGFNETQIERIGELVTMDFDGYTQLHGKELLAKSNVARIFLEKMTTVPLKFDPLIIRAFEYYTSTVFEVFDADPANRRSLFGGGRYDNLVALFSNKRIPGIGFGMGDVTLMDFLDTHGLLPQAKISPDVYMIPLDMHARPTVKQLADELRNAGLRIIVPLETQSLKKEIKEAARSGARFAVILGEEELKQGSVIVRDLIHSEQSQIPQTLLIDAFKKDASPRLKSIDSAVYEDAKDEQAHPEERILEREQLSAKASLSDRGRRNIVALGSVVHLRTNDDQEYRFTLVGAFEADPGKGRISNDSPVGKALLDHKTGDVVIVRTPAGVKEYTILGIDNDSITNLSVQDSLPTRNA